MLLLLLERRRIPKVKTSVMVSAVLLWPFFLLLNVLLNILAFFNKNMKWKPIPHGLPASAPRVKCREK